MDQAPTDLPQSRDVDPVRGVTARTPIARTARERARQQITAELLEVARTHLDRHGPGELSLRAIARDLGMVSSAVYRYVPNRDALLTLLIIDAYNDLGAAAESAEGAVARDELPQRFSAVCHAIRAWALAHPQQYALIYGSPVPGYSAPEDTIAPAGRIPALLIRILQDAATARGTREPAEHSASDVSPVEVAVAEAIAPVREFAGGAIPDGMLLRGLEAWSGVFGLVSFELFGHIQGAVLEGPDSRLAYFDHQVRDYAIRLGVGG